MERQRTKQDAEYAVYKGEDLVAMGTAFECAVELGVQPATIQFYSRPVHHRRAKARKNPEKAVVAIRMERDDEEDGIDQG